jgi:vacuolar-type H+-ATPase subunit E/Vma4
MDSVKVHKSELIAKLQENRAAHRAIYEEALAGYRDVALEKLEAYIARVRGGEVEVITLVLAKPEDHTRDYDRIIAMAEASVDDVLELAEHDFQRYWLDDWNWRQSFLASNSAYSQTATQMLQG